MGKTLTEPVKQLRNRFWIFLLIAIAFVVWSRPFLRPLSSGDIVQYEIARTVSNATAIQSDWASTVGMMDKAIQSIYLDYAFIILYVSLLAISCLYFSKLSGHDILARAGKFFVFLLVGAGICDVIENISMYSSLTSGPTRFNVRLAYDMAVAKFSVIILTILFIAVCLVFALFKNREEEQEFTRRYPA